MPSRLEAGSDRESMEPGIPGIRVPERTHALPGGHECLLDRILGTVPVAEDERGDSVLA